MIGLVFCPSMEASEPPRPPIAATRAMSQDDAWVRLGWCVFLAGVLCWISSSSVFPR